MTDTLSDEEIDRLLNGPQDPVKVMLQVGRIVRALRSERAARVRAEAERDAMASAISACEPALYELSGYAAVSPIGLKRLPKLADEIAKLLSTRPKVTDE